MSFDPTWKPLEFAATEGDPLPPVPADPLCPTGVVMEVTHRLGPDGAETELLVAHVGPVLHRWPASRCRRVSPAEHLELAKAWLESPPRPPLPTRDFAA